MDALVTGARGFIGRTLCARLRAGGHQVTRAVHSDPGPGDAVVDVHERTVDASRCKRDGIEGFDAVFNLFGEPLTTRRWGPAKREQIRASRIATTDILCRSLAKSSSKPAVIVSMSAVGVYGDRGDEEVDEKSALGRGFLAEVCREWEAATGPAREVGIRVVTARNSVVIGPSGGMIATVAPLYRLGLGARLGDGRQWMSWISLRDEVDALVHLATSSSLDGPVNLSTESPLRNSDFTNSLACAIGERARLLVPRAVLYALLGRAVTDELVLQSARVHPRALLESGFSFTDTSISDALDWALERRLS